MANASDHTARGRVLTLHPKGKQGASIDRVKYDEMRRAILRSMPRGRAGIALSELTDAVRERIDARVFGPAVGLKWHLITVKQDLEARGEIEIVPGSRPQRLRRGREGAR